MELADEETVDWLVYCGLSCDPRTAALAQMVRESMNVTWQVHNKSPDRRLRQCVTRIRHRLFWVAPKIQCYDLTLYPKAHFPKTEQIRVNRKVKKLELT